MKHQEIAIVLTTVLALYAGVNYYLFIRTSQALEGLGAMGLAVQWTLLFAMLAYPCARVLELVSRSGFSRALVVAGSVYLGIMFYGFLAAAIVDLLRLGNHFFRFFPAWIVENPAAAGLIAWCAAAGVVLVIVGTGWFVSLSPHLSTCDVPIAKKAGGLKSLNIVLVSDIHLGPVTGASRLRRIAALIGTAEPDIVLLGGDTFDEDVSEEVEIDAAEILETVQARFGVYAVTGNHEYYGGVEGAVKHLTRAGITVLQDSAVKIGDAFWLIGRKDRTAIRQGGRRPIRDLCLLADKSLPLILLDHQPFHLEDAAECGVDLQLSGHTHHGQLFPLNLFYRFIYEKSRGYVRKGKTQYVVSCGAGTWGPPVRTSSRPEVMLLRLSFAP